MFIFDFVVFVLIIYIFLFGLGCFWNIVLFFFFFILVESVVVCVVGLRVGGFFGLGVLGIFMLCG